MRRRSPRACPRGNCPARQFVDAGAPWQPPPPVPHDRRSASSRAMPRSASAADSGGRVRAQRVGERDPADERRVLRRRRRSCARLTRRCERARGSIATPDSARNAGEPSRTIVVCRRAAPQTPRPAMRRERCSMRQRHERERSRACVEDRAARADASRPARAAHREAYELALGELRWLDCTADDRRRRLWSASRSCRRRACRSSRRARAPRHS